MVDDVNNKSNEINAGELIEVIKKEVKLNAVEVNGVLVQSSTESLKDCEECVNRLVERHQNFLLLKKEMAMKTGYMG